MADSSRDVVKLLILGIIFHIVFIASVFDCYFRSPVVHGMTRFGATTGESKRLVLIVGMSNYTTCIASRSHALKQVTAFELISCSLQTRFRQLILPQR